MRCIRLLLRTFLTLMYQKCSVDGQLRRALQMAAAIFLDQLWRKLHISVVGLFTGFVGA